MHHARWHHLMKDDTLKLTDSEQKEGWHWCNEFDGLLVKGDPNQAYCGPSCIGNDDNLEGCSTPGCGYPDGKPCIRCGFVAPPD